MRLDKWLWAARFFKTRGLAADAVKGGRVHLNDQPAKPSKDVKPGDRLEITIGQSRFVVDVRGTSERRGPAVEAAKLYEETAESRVARERQQDVRRFSPEPALAIKGRPTKRDRRRLDDFLK